MKKDLYKVLWKEIVHMNRVIGTADIPALLLTWRSSLTPPGLCPLEISNIPHGVGERMK